jgi:hypothetical protein
LEPFGATLEALSLIAAFCRLAKSVSHSEHMGWLVGAVGIEITVNLQIERVYAMFRALARSPIITVTLL